MELPECAWDLEQGLVVLWRAAAQAPETDPGFTLVVASADGAERYFAGDWPAAQTFFTLKAPASGRFEIQLYPLGALAALDGPPPALPDGTPATLALDARLQVSTDHPAGHQPIRGWLLLPPEDDSGWPSPQPIDVPPHATLIDTLADAGWTADGHIGLAVARHAADAAACARGPMSNPLRPDAVLDCIFTLIPDDTPPPLALPSFATLGAPAIYVDVTAFGAALDELRAALWFFHRRYGPDDDLRGWSGLQVPVWDDAESGRRYLACVFDDACHLDHIGVLTAGGTLLEPLPDAPPDAEPSLALHHRSEAPLGVSDCIAALFHGDACLLLPDLAAEYKARAPAECAELDTEALHLHLNSAWLDLSELSDVADWQGAAAAEPFTLLAYLDLLEQTLADTDPALVPLADLLGIGARRFADFAQQPQLAYALVQEPQLRQRLAQAITAEADISVGELTPAAMLAALLEPNAGQLCHALQQRSPALQRAVWRYLLAGGRAEDWLRLDMPAELADTANLADLARRIGNGLAAKAPAYVVATLADIGAAPLADLPLTRLPQVLARAEAMEQAAAALRQDLKKASPALQQFRPGLTPDVRELLPRFEAAFGTGRVAAMETLRGRLLAALSGATDSMALRMAVSDLRTRVALWWLAGALAVATDDGLAEGTPPRVEPEPVPNPPPSDGHADAIAATRPRPDTRAPTEQSPDPADAEDTAAQAGDPPQATDASAAALPPPSEASTATPRPEPVSALQALAWCRALLIDGETRWPPADATAAAAADLDLCEADIAEREELWGMDGPHPYALPAWTGERAERHRALAEHIRDIAGRLTKGAKANAEDDTGTLRTLIEDILALREQIAADLLWTEIKQAGTMALRAARPEHRADLAQRIDYAAPPDWDALAQELEGLAGRRVASGTP